MALLRPEFCAISVVHQCFLDASLNYALSSGLTGQRTFRAGLWLIAIAIPPYWLILWQVGIFMRLFGQAPELAEQGQTFLRAYMWCTAPWLLFQLLRNFVAALERPRVVLGLSLGGIALNALLSWALIFGHFGLPALGLRGGGLGSTLTWLAMCGARVIVLVRVRLLLSEMCGEPCRTFFAADD